MGLWVWLLLGYGHYYQFAEIVFPLGIIKHYYSFFDCYYSSRLIKIKDIYFWAKAEYVS